MGSESELQVLHKLSTEKSYANNKYAYFDDLRYLFLQSSRFAKQS